MFGKCIFPISKLRSITKAKYMYTISTIHVAPSSTFLLPLAFTFFPK